ncbi:sterol desaturase family protein [Pseudomonas putida]|uniref:sterol desaturase family protein n=1 Tax=Pseudomonas putida TaxID=303 RepID=UPI001A8D80DF|nr:sterol desaturase family protein [Pseudomonas putida]MBO0369533.1 sterol desaturase family protein [Pseudomonas putida]
MLFNLVVLLGTLVTMEGVGTLAHKYIMHGWGWWLHRSHHQPQLGVLETNDVYLVALALIAAALVALGKAGHAPLQWVGAGVAGYGLLYVVAHDGLFHRHWPRRLRPVNRYLKRLHRAHRLHHAVKGREGCVSFGFFYAPPLRVLRRQLCERSKTALK